MEPRIDYRTTETRTRAASETEKDGERGLLLLMCADALANFAASRADLRSEVVDYLKVSGLVAYLAPTFADGIPEPAFDILSEHGPSNVVIIWRTHTGSIGWKSFPSALRAVSYNWRLDGGIVVYEAFESDAEWHWSKCYEWNGGVWAD